MGCGFFDIDPFLEKKKQVKDLTPSPVCSLGSPKPSVLFYKLTYKHGLTYTPL